MSVWFTYSLGDFIPFSIETYRAAIRLYGEENMLLCGLSLVAGLGLIFCARGYRGWGLRIGLVILAMAWLHGGLGFLDTRLLPLIPQIEPARWLFMTEAALLLLCALGPVGPCADGVSASLRWRGLLILAFAVLNFGLGTGIAPAGVPIGGFGILPDPTAVATLAFLLICRGWARLILMIVPLIWCVFALLLLMGMDAEPLRVAMPIAGIACALMALAAWVDRTSGGSPLDALGRSDDNNRGGQEYRDDKGEDPPWN